MENIKYPIGRYQPPKQISLDNIYGWIGDIEIFPADLKKESLPLSDEQLDTPYREKGWTIRQLIHHIADSHTNAYIRVKLTLTEECPTIKDYQQDRWAELADSTLPLESSLKIIEAIHERWVYLLKKLDSDQLNRELIHPKSGKMILKSLIGLYAWHGKHHLAHITSLKKRNNW